jgi:hypothetical protein
MDPYDVDEMVDVPGMGEDGALYIDFSSEEASSESRDYEPLPSGKYLVTITDVELRESQSEKNNGKPYYAIEFTVVDDLKGGGFAQAKRKCWTNAMLFKPALFTITHIMKATGFPVNEGRVRIPTPAELMGKTLVVGGVKTGETRDKNDPTKVYQPKFEPKSYFGEDRWKGSAARGGTVTTKAGATTADDLLS